MKHLSKSELESMTPEQKLSMFRQMAEEYCKEHGCRWAEACLAVKRRYPESRTAFGAPTEGYENLPVSTNIQ